ncbi:MAG: diguanylate cyclase [Nitrospirota bacterium]
MLEKSTHSGSAPQIAPSELKNLKSKAETGELDVKSLSNRANFIFKSYEDRLAALPKAFRYKLKRQIVSYILNSADNYDKNAIKGLGKLEFKKFRRAMLSSASMILNKYAPSKAMIEARRKEKRAHKDYRAEMEKLMRGKPKFTSKNDSFSTADLTSPERIQDETLKIRSQSGTMQDEGGKMLEKIARTKHSYMVWKSAGVQVKAAGRFYGGDSRTDINSDMRFINSSDILARFQKKQKSVEAHGKLLIERGKLLKTVIREKRDKELAEFDIKNKGDEGKKLKNREQYQKFLEARIAILEKKGKLDALSDVEKKVLIINRKKAALVFTKKDRLTKAEGAMGGALAQINTALQNPNLPKEARDRLEKNKKILSKKQSHLAFDINNASRFENQVKESDSMSKRRELALKNGCVRIDDYLGSTLNPSINALDDSLRTLEIEQLKNGTEREQIIAKYAKYDDVVDRLNAGVAENVMHTNLSNALLVTTLGKELTSVKKLSSLESIGTLGRLSASLEGTSDGIKWYLKDNVVDKGLDPFAKWLSGSDIPVLSEVGKLAGGVVTVTSGLVELSQELLSSIPLILAHPIDTVKGLSMLFRPSTAAEAWKKVFEGTVSKKDWQDGHYIKAGTKNIANILLTVTGVTAVKGGLTAARASLVASRGLGLMRRTFMVTRAFFDGFGTSLGQSGHTFLGKSKSLLKLFFTKEGLQKMAKVARDKFKRKPKKTSISPSPGVQTDKTPKIHKPDPKKEKNLQDLNNKAETKNRAATEQTLDQLGVTGSNRDLIRETYFDKNTGLMNRNGLSELDEMIKRGEKVTVASYDADHFKAYNDLKGTAYGDKVIKLIGRRVNKLVEELRAKGYKTHGVRMGGEEIVIFGNVPKKTLHKKMQEMAKKLKEDIRSTLTRDERTQMATEIAHAKYEKKGKKAFGLAKSEIGGSTAAVVEVDASKLANKRGKAKELIILADEILEKRKNKTGRGQIIEHSGSASETAAELANFKPKNELNVMQNRNLARDTSSLTEASQAYFRQHLPELNKLETTKIAKLELQRALKSPSTKIDEIAKILEKHGIKGDRTSLATKLQKEYFKAIRDHGTYTGASTMNHFQRRLGESKPKFKYDDVTTIQIGEFKSFNETLGHTGGDTFLTMLHMKVIQGTIKRFGIPKKHIMVAQKGADFKICISAEYLKKVPNIQARLNKTMGREYRRQFSRFRKAIDRGSGKRYNSSRRAWIGENKASTLKQSLRDAKGLIITKADTGSKKITK